MQGKGITEDTAATESFREVYTGEIRFQHQNPTSEVKIYL
jgi:hypothetical protein